MSFDARKVQSIYLPDRNPQYAGMNFRRVRKNGDKFQVQSTGYEIGMPYGQSIREWIEELQAEEKSLQERGLEDVTIDHFTSWDEDTADTIEIFGWYDATPRQLSIIEEKWESN